MRSENCEAIDQNVVLGGCNLHGDAGYLAEGDGSGRHLEKASSCPRGLLTSGVERDDLSSPEERNEEQHATER